jgi:hypothetical protein
MLRDLYVAWQEPETRTWNTIARLRRTGDEYEFLFTRGVTKLNSIPLDLFRMDINKRYRSVELIPLFRNRLLSRSRADFSKVASWLGLKGNESEFESLSKFGLIPGSDSILIYPAPELINRSYSVEFFVHGIRHMHADMASHCDALTEGSLLLPLLDVKNPVDPNAVAFRTKSDFRLIGYLPAFYAGDIRTILSKPTLAKTAKVSVVKNNKDAPIQLRLLCRFEAEVDQDFVSLNSDVHRPLLDEAA